LFHLQALHQYSSDEILVGGEGKLGNREEVYITFDPEVEEQGYIALSAAELSLNLAKGISIKPIASCISNSSACIERPIVTCDDTDKDVIYLRVAEKPAVVFNENCVVIQGTDEELVMATDRFILYWYEIMR